MGSKKHDDIIKQKLSSLENKHRTPDWNQFSSMLDDMNEKDLEFDLKVSQKLSKLSENIYVRPEWNKLYRIITERAARRKRVLITKGSEIFVLLLLLFTGYNLLTIYPKPNSAKTKESLQYASNLTKSSETIIDLSTTETTQNTSNSNSKQTREKKSETLNNSIAQASIKNNSKKQFFDVVSTKKLSTPIKPLEFSKSSKNADSNFALLGKEYSNQLYMTRQSEMINNSRIDVPNKNIDILALNPLVVKTGLEDVAHPVQTLASEKGNFWSKIQIGAFLTNKFNYITIPEKKNFLFDRKQGFVNTTINGGAIAEYKHKNFALSMGLEYTKINYKLKASALEGSFLTSYQTTTLNSIKYDFISIPIDMKCYMYQMSDWNLSLLTGIGIDVLGTSDYTLEVSSNKSSVIVPPDHLSSKSRLASLNYQTGVLDSDERANEFNSSNKLMDNLYTKIRLGVGLQKQLNSKIGIFTDFIYQHQIDKEKGVGPNFDLIDSYAINIGVKYRLG